MQWLGVRRTTSTCLALSHVNLQLSSPKSEREEGVAALLFPTTQAPTWLWIYQPICIQRPGVLIQELFWTASGLVILHI